MKKCISFGEFNKYYIYILLTIFFLLLNDSLYGFNYVDIFEDVKIINTDTQQYFSFHHLIHQIFNYFGTCILGFIFYKYEKKISKRELNKSGSNIPKEEKKRKNHIVLIHNNGEKKINTKSNYFLLLFIIFLWILEEQLIDIYSYALKDLDFWMVELLIVTYFSASMFNIQIYNHQKFAIWLSIIPCLLKVGTIILSVFNTEEHISGYSMPILYIIEKIFIPIGIIIYLILIFLRSYVNTKIKWFMDLKFISSNKLLIYYGIIGTITCSLVSILTTFVKCKDINEDYDLYDYICRIPYNGTDKKNKDNQLYFENFIYYYETFKGEMNNNFKKIEILYEFIIIFAGIITFFFEKFFSVLVIKKLTPVHLIFSIPIFFFCQKLILVIYNIIKKQSLDIKSNIKYINIKFILDCSGDFVSFFGFLIYLEIIELNCEKISHNLKKNIIRRSFGESYGINSNEKSLINSEEEENEDEGEGETEEDEDLSTTH